MGTEVILLSPASSASSFHLTLHDSCSSDPFFISCQARVQHRRVSWHDLERGTHEFGGVRSVILRLWRDGENQLVLGLTFSGLVCVGEEVTDDLMANCGENTLVFRLHGRLFVWNQCLHQPLDQKRYLEVPNLIDDGVCSSYDDMSLWLVDMALRALKGKEESILSIQKESSVKMEVRPKKKKSTLVKLLNDMTLQV